MAIGGIDVGTSSVKMVVYNEQGAELISASRSYDPVLDEGYEMDGAKILQAVKDVIKECSSRISEEIKAIAVSSMGETAIPLDKNDHVLHNSMYYVDARGTEEWLYLEDVLGRSKICETIGSPTSAAFTLPKIMYVKKHMDYYKNVDKYLLCEDFVGYMLTGERKISYSLARTSMGFDIRSLKWSKEIFDAADLDMTMFSQPQAAGEVVGQVLPSVAKELGLPKDMIVVTGGHDQFCAPLGVGMVDETVFSNGMGSSDALHVTSDALFPREFADQYDYAQLPYVLPGQYCSLAGVVTSGNMLRWYVGAFSEAMEGRLAKAGMNFYDYMESKMGLEPSGLVTLPSFSMVNSPMYRPDSRGTIWGMTTSTSEEMIYRSLLEGVAYGQYLNMELMKSVGVKFGEMRASGGGSLSGVWLQTRSDIYNCLVRQCGKGAGTNACLILCSYALGNYASIVDAAKALVKTGKVFEPSKERHEKYMEIYQKFKKFYYRMTYDMEAPEC